MDRRRVRRAGGDRAGGVLASREADGDDQSAEWFFCFFSRTLHARPAARVGGNANRSRRISHYDRCARSDVTAGFERPGNQFHTTSRLARQGRTMNDRLQQRFLAVAEFVRIQISRTVGTLTSSATARTVLYAMIAWLATLTGGAQAWAQTEAPAGKPAGEQKTAATADSNMPDISGVWSI